MTTIDYRFFIIALIFSFAAYISLITTGILTAVLVKFGFSGRLAVFGGVFVFYLGFWLTVGSVQKLSRAALSSNSENELRTRNRRWGWSDLGALAALSLFAVAFSEFILCSTIDFVPHTWGDEDFHHIVGNGLTRFVTEWGWLNLGQHYFPQSVRYPVLYYAYIHQVGTLLSTGESIAFFRRCGYGPFVATILLVYWVARDVGCGRLLSFLFGMSIAVDGLLIAYLNSLYLDLPHVPILFAGGYLAYKAMTDLSITKFASGTLLIGLAPLVRDSVLPGVAIFLTLSAIGFAFLYWKKFPRVSIFRPLLYVSLVVVFGLFPGVSYVIAKSLMSSVDVGRLSISNMLQQDYRMFFAVLMIHLPFWILVALVWYVGIRTPIEKRDGPQSGRWFARPETWSWLAIVGYSLMELALYSGFQLGWMPWSRNYLMFLGLIYVAGFIIIHKINSYDVMTASTVILPALIATIIFKILITVSFMGRSVIYNENEVLNDYKKLKECLLIHSIGKRVAVHIPIQLPYSFRYVVLGNYIFDAYKPLILSDPQMKMELLPTTFAKKDVDFENFMTYDLFLSKIGENVDQVIFHYHASQGLFRVNQALVVAKPNISPPNKILCDIPDPLSLGVRGVLLIQLH